MEKEIPKYCGYFWAGHFLYMGRCPANTEHMHYALQVIVNREGLFRLQVDESSIECGGAIIGSGQPHQLFSPGNCHSWIHLLIDHETDVAKTIEGILKETPGVQTYDTIGGFSLLSIANTSYNAFYFVTLKPWEERTPEGLTADNMMRRLNQRLAGLPDAQAFAFGPPAIPGIGTSGGATFMLEDRSGQGVEFLAQNTERFLQAARQRSASAGSSLPSESNCVSASNAKVTISPVGTSVDSAGSSDRGS